MGKVAKWQPATGRLLDLTCDALHRSPMVGMTVSVAVAAPESLNG